jgi:hypothetical protein
LPISEQPGLEQTIWKIAGQQTLEADDKLASSTFVHVGGHDRQNVHETNMLRATRLAYHFRKDPGLFTARGSRDTGTSFAQDLSVRPLSSHQILRVCPGRAPWPRRSAA